MYRYLIIIRKKAAIVQPFLFYSVQKFILPQLYHLQKYADAFHGQA